MFRHLWRKSLSKAVTRPVGRPRSPRSHLGVDLLEDRTVPSFFGPNNLFPTGTAPAAIATGDFNGDGKADLVVANSSANTISVLLGNGDGTYGAKSDFATGTFPVGLAVADFNGDGKLDVAVVNSLSNSVSVLLGTGTGAFGPKTDIPLGISPVAITAADFNGDGKVDLAVATETITTDDLTLLMGTGTGLFSPPVTTVTDTSVFGLWGGGHLSIATADFNADGKADIVVVNNKDAVTFVGRAQIRTRALEAGSVSVVLGNGNGTFQAPRNFTVNTGATSVAVGDFNGDGQPDFAVGSNSVASVNVFSNTGGGNFTPSTLTIPTVSSITLPGVVTAGDFNGDGAADLAVPVTLGNFATPAVQMFTGQVGGTLHAGPTYAAGLGNTIAADVNGDGKVDLVGSATNAVQPLLNPGTGQLPAPSFIPAGGVTFSGAATGDFNGDSIPDLVTASTGVVQLGLGDGRFGDPTTLPVPLPLFGSSANNTVAAVDADGNGTTDILIGNPNYPVGQVAAFFNSPGYDNRTGNAVNFVVSAPSQIAAGDNTSVTVTAVDALGNPAANFLGTVDLDFTPAGSTALNLAGQYTFTAGDAGRHTFLFSNVTQPGLGQLSAFAVAMPTATSPLTVVPAALSQFVFSTPGSVAAGTPFNFAISATDRFGNLRADYTGTVHFSAQAADTNAVLPTDYTFTAADAGTHTFSATLYKTAGAIINAKDIVTGVNTSGPINVTALAPVGLLAGLPTGTTAGTSLFTTVTAVDIYGNRATSYTGTIHFSSSDPQAALPPDYTFTAADAGSRLFFPALRTAGTQSLNIADTVNPAFAISQSMLVIPAATSVLALNGLPVNTVAGVAQSFTITPMDAYGNRSTYSNLVQFSSSDQQASLPGSWFFTPADAGTHVFTATLKTAGAQTITASDATFSFPNGSASISVTPAATASFTVAGFPATTAGVAHNVTVTARDAYGNVATGYTGTAVFSSSDPIASLPANYTFTSADAGAHTFTATLKRAGTQFIQAADTVSGSIIGAENGIAVSAAAVTHFVFSGPSTVTQGVGFKVTVSAVDDFGNVNAGYRGSVRLSGDDPSVGPQGFTFSSNDNGVHVFSYTFNRLGLDTLTIVDLANSSIIGTDTVNVVPK